MLPTNLMSAIPQPPPPRTMSPELAQAREVRTPESQTLMASPLADRLAGAVMHQQQIAQGAKISEALQGGLKMLANLLRLSDPKAAAKFEKMAADLLSRFPPSAGPPQTAGGVNMMAGMLPPGGGPTQAFPPAPVAGTNRMPGSMMAPPPLGGL